MTRGICLRDLLRRRSPAASAPEPAAAAHRGPPARACLTDRTCLLQQRRSFLLLGTCSMVAAGAALAAPSPSPAERMVARRIELWARASVGRRSLVARYRLTRHSSMFYEPLVALGAFAFRAPDQLVFRDDERTGSTTRISGGELELRANDPEVAAAPAIDPYASPARNWLRDHLLALFDAPRDPADPGAALLVDARASIPRGAGSLLDLSPQRDHPARRQLRDLIVRLHPQSGEMEHLELFEAGGDRVTIAFSQRRADVPEDELAALLSGELPPGTDQKRPPL